MKKIHKTHQKNFFNPFKLYDQLINEYAIYFMIWKASFSNRKTNNGGSRFVFQFNTKIPAFQTYASFIIDHHCIICGYRTICLLKITLDFQDWGK